MGLDEIAGLLTDATAKSGECLAVIGNTRGELNDGLAANQQAIQSLEGAMGASQSPILATAHASLTAVDEAVQEVLRRLEDAARYSAIAHEHMEAMIIRITH